MRWKEQEQELRSNFSSFFVCSSLSQSNKREKFCVCSNDRDESVGWVGVEFFRIFHSSSVQIGSNIHFCRQLTRLFGPDSQGGMSGCAKGLAGLAWCEKTRRREQTGRSDDSNQFVIEQFSISRFLDLNLFIWSSEEGSKLNSGWKTLMSHMSSDMSVFLYYIYILITYIVLEHVQYCKFYHIFFIFNLMIFELRHQLKFKSVVVPLKLHQKWKWQNIFIRLIVISHLNWSKVGRNKSKKTKSHSYPWKSHLVFDALRFQYRLREFSSSLHLLPWNFHMDSDGVNCWMSGWTSRYSLCTLRTCLHSLIFDTLQDS